MAEPRERIVWLPYVAGAVPQAYYSGTIYIFTFLPLIPVRIFLSASFVLAFLGSLGDCRAPCVSGGSLVGQSSLPLATMEKRC